MMVNAWILGWKASLTSMGDCFYKSIGDSLFGVFCFHIKEAQSQALKNDPSLWHSKLPPSSTSFSYRNWEFYIHFDLVASHRFPFIFILS